MSIYEARILIYSVIIISIVGFLIWFYINNKREKEEMKEILEKRKERVAECDRLLGSDYFGLTIKEIRRYTYKNEPWDRQSFWYVHPKTGKPYEWSRFKTKTVNSHYWELDKQMKKELHDYHEQMHKEKPHIFVSQYPLAPPPPFINYQPTIADKVRRYFRDH